MLLKSILKAGCLAMTLVLAGCSYHHEIDFSLQNGRMHFRFDDGKPVALQQLYVVELASEVRTVWRLESIDDNGHDLTELFYAAVPPGMKQGTAAAPLRVGQLYRVEFFTVDGGGSQEFVISPAPENGQPNQATIVRE